MAEKANSTGPVSVVGYDAWRRLIPAAMPRQESGASWSPDIDTERRSAEEGERWPRRAWARIRRAIVASRHRPAPAS